jgi:predicted deacylase
VLPSFRVSVIVLLLLALALPATADRFDDTMKRVRLLSNSPNVRLLPFGRSTQGRPIPAFAVSDFSIGSAAKARMLIVAGQHGDEYNPVKAVLSLSRDLAAGSRKSLTERCIILVIPMANPDGVSCRSRFNANGVDINRDWLDRGTLEARYIHSVIKAWRPQAILDTHEWTGPSPVPANGVELAGIAKQSQIGAMADLAARMAHASGLALIRDTTHGDGRLFHRRYSELGYASYLIETAPGEDYSLKSRAYAAAIEQVAETLASQSKLRSVLSPSSTAFNAAAVSAYLEPAQIGPFADPESAALGFAASAVAAYCLMMWIIRPLAAKSETTWSRKFRKCSIDWDMQTHPLLKKRGLQPLTSRSWAHRKLRSRYASAQSLTAQSELV